MARRVSLSVEVTQDAELPRVLEVVGRAMAGLVLEGIDASIFTYADEDGPGEQP